MSEINKMAEKFAKEMQEIVDKYDNLSRETGMLDIEYRHLDMDDLICRTLDALGFNEGVEIFTDTKKYYA